MYKPQKLLHKEFCKEHATPRESAWTNEFKLWWLLGNKVGPMFVQGMSPLHADASFHRAQLS